MVEFEDAVSERMAQLEQEDLERYQRDLDSQRRIIRMRRPIQRFEMSVQDYYRRFCYWKEEMISVGYPDDESIYIDHFIGDLQWKIRLKVLERRSSLSRLTDAYYEAHHHEVMIRLDELIKDFRAANDIGEMANQTTIEIQGDGEICISMEKESVDNSQQAESDVENLKEVIAEPYAHQLFDVMPMSLSIELKEEDGDSDGAGACDEQYTAVEIQSNGSAIKSAEDGKLLPNSFIKYEETEQNEENDCVVLGKIDVQIDADKVLVKMTEPILEENLLGIGVTEAAHSLLDQRPVLSPVDLDENFIQVVSYADDILEFSVANSQSFTKLGFNPQIFDPGTLAHYKKENYESPLNASDSQLYGILLTERVMSCEITVNSSIKQNGENDDYRLCMFLNFYAPPMLYSVNSINALHKTWVKGVTSRMVVNLGPIVKRNDAQDMLDETTPAFRTNVIDGQLMEPYIRGPLDVKLQLDLPTESNSSLYINNVRHAKFSWIAHIVAHGENYIEVDLNTLIDSELLMMKFSFDPGGCPLPNLKMYEQSTLIEMNEGDVVDGGVVLSVLDLQATLGSLGDLTVNGPDNGSTKAWRDEATFAIKNVHRKYAIVDDAYKEVGEMTQAIRATLLDDEVTNHYAKYASFNTLILFDPGGREVAHPLFGKAQAVFVFGFKAKQNIGSERLGKLEPSMADFQDVAMEMVLMIGPGISSLLYEIFQSFQEAQLDDQVLDPYTNGFYFNNRTIFDPGGDIYYALSYENSALLSLWGNHKTVGQSMGVCLCSILALLHDTDEMQSAGDRHILEINFHFWCNPVGMSEFYDVTMMKIVVAILASLVWDPGISAIFVYILEDKDVFKRVRKWIMVLLKLRSVRAADFLFKECSSKPSIQQNEGNHVSNIDEAFVQIENFDMFSTDPKEVVVLVRMSFSTHLMKFAQLLSWSPESSKLTGWSIVLSYIHNFVNIGLVHRGNYVHDSLKATLQQYSNEWC